MSDEKSTMHEGLKIQYAPLEIDYLKGLINAKDEQIDTLGELIEYLKGCIQNAPCLVASPGEFTYECRVDNPCRVCQWRREVSDELQDEWHITEGIW